VGTDCAVAVEECRGSGEAARSRALAAIPETAPFIPTTLPLRQEAARGGAGPVTSPGVAAAFVRNPQARENPPGMRPAPGRPRGSPAATGAFVRRDYPLDAGNRMALRPARIVQRG